MHVMVLLLVVAVAVTLALVTKPRDGSRRRRRFPKPGEGMRRRELPTAAVGTPPGTTVLRRGVPAEEAHVLVGLLRSAGIRAELNAGRSTFVHRGMPTSFDVVVPVDRVGAARDVLGRARE